MLTEAGAVPPYFAGLFPEGRRLSAVRRAVKTSVDDELSLLLAVGGDAIGDVSVLPEGETPSPMEPAVEVSRQGQLDFAKLFAKSTGENPDRVGIPGFQDKVSARMITLPVTHGETRHILKLNPPEFLALVENEAFFLAAAGKSGIDTAEAQVLHDVAGRTGLLVRRFDRTVVDGEVRALAVEDGCQALGRYPADKYAVTSENVAHRLAELTRSPAVAARDLLRQFVFAYLSCNGDAHAKNFSILQSPTGERRVSPAYDLPSSYPSGDYTLALSVGGRPRADLTRGVFAAFGRTLGLAERATSRVLDDLCDSVDGWIDDIDTLPFDRQRVRKLKRAVACRRGQPARTPT